MNTKNTKQRSIIIKMLQQDKNHPTIKELYKSIKEKYPNIGQATVYRNINKLLDDGKIVKIKTSTNIDHYDGNIIPHYHLECKKCHRIIDIYDSKYDKTIKNIEREYSIKIDQASILFDGICDRCNEEVQV